MEELWENGSHENGTERFQGCRILFAVPLGKNGVNRGYYKVLAWLRCGKPVLEGALAGFLIDADSELYTKAAARELAVAANGGSGPGGPSSGGGHGVSGQLYHPGRQYGQAEPGGVQKSTGSWWSSLWRLNGTPRKEPHLLVLHASSHKTSNTLEVWNAVKEKIEDHVEIREVELKKRAPGGLLRLSLSDVPAFWRAGKMLLRRAYCGIRISRDPVGRWDSAFMPQL